MCKDPKTQIPVAAERLRKSPLLNAAIQTLLWECFLNESISFDDNGDVYWSSCGLAIDPAIKEIYVK